MKKIVWVSCVLALLLWSLASWAFGWLLTGGGDFLAAQAQAWSYRYPEAELAAASASAWLAQFGTVALWLLWGAGGLVIVFLAWLAVEALGGLQTMTARLAPHAGAATGWLRERLPARAHEG